MPEKTIDSIIDEISGYHGYDGEYHDRMIHPFPDTEVVHRERFILSKCEGKVVLDIGCAGPFHKKVEEVAKETWGIDRVDVDTPHFFKADLNREPIPFPVNGKFDLILCGEILEHLSNPGFFLDGLKGASCPIILSVPNAYCSYAIPYVKKGQENVNKEHVAWYSWKTLKTLVERHGFEVQEFYWSDSRPEPPDQGFTEGLIFQIVKGGSDGKV